VTIGLLYENSENDERGIRLTAEELGVGLTFIPFRKVAVSIDETGFGFSSKGKDYFNVLKDVDVVLNRAQSKNRRLYAANIMEVLGKNVINSSYVEFECYSKFRTLMRLWADGLPIPKTVYVPCDPYEAIKGGKGLSNESDIADLLEQHIGREIVIKPDAGTHGKGIVLSKDRETLISNIRGVEQSIINPVGVVAQERVDKWFYDLRIIVFKEKGKDPVCHPVALARAGFGDFRTNTFLGNMVFDARLPQSVRELAIKCGKSLGGENEAWLLALDAMINVGANKTADDDTIKTEMRKAAVRFEDVKNVKRDESRLHDFKAWNSALETAFRDYKSTDSYAKIKGVIEGSVDSGKQSIVFHEANSCPEFWENTRLVAGINVAVPLIKCAQSLVKA
jgi:glutathione synthase/RimK-type ligase-like ATP-grasp enzyme